MEEKVLEAYEVVKALTPYERGEYSRLLLEDLNEDNLALWIACRKFSLFGTLSVLEIINQVQDIPKHETIKDYYAAYPYEPGISWPPKNLDDVRSNCRIWREIGYYE